MKIFISVVFNWLILFAISQFMPEWVTAIWGLKLYFVWWVVLWLLNFTVRPLLKILWLPFLILTLGLFIFVINGVILYLLQNIIRWLNIAWVEFEIKWIVNFIIAVAIFSIFNTMYNTFLKG